MVGAILLLATLDPTSLAFAKDRAALKLDYAVSDDAEGCPDEAGLRAKVAARLGYDPFTTSATSATPAAAPERGKSIVVTRIRKKGGGFESRIEMRDAAGKLRGKRELEASSCADLAASTAFALAVAIDPEEAHEVISPPPVSPAAAPDAPQTVPAVTRVPPAEPPPISHPEPSRPAPLEWTPTLSMGLSVAGLGPYATASPGGVVGIELQRAALGVGLEARASLPTSVPAGAGSVRTNNMGVSPVICAHIGGAAFCAKVFLGAFQGAAEGVVAAEKQTTFFSTVGVHASYTFRPFRASGFGIGLHAGPDMILTRTRLDFRGKEVWSTAPVSIEASLRGSYAFF